MFDAKSQDPQAKKTEPWPTTAMKQVNELLANMPKIYKELDWKGPRQSANTWACLAEVREMTIELQEECTSTCSWWSPKHHYDYRLIIRHKDMPGFLSQVEGEVVEGMYKSAMKEPMRKFRADNKERSRRDEEEQIHDNLIPPC